MAVRHCLIERPVEDVWTVLADPLRNGDWVVGTSRSMPEGIWPHVDASIACTVRLGRWAGGPVGRLRAPGRSALRGPICAGLEAESGPLGTARIALTIRPWGRYTLVIIDEHSLRGPAAKFHITVVDALVQSRHRSMLARLAKTVEETAGSAQPVA